MYGISGFFSTDVMLGKEATEALGENVVDSDTLEPSRQ